MLEDVKIRLQQLRIELQALVEFEPHVLLQSLYDMEAAVRDMQLDVCPRKVKSYWLTQDRTLATSTVGTTQRYGADDYEYAPSDSDTDDDHTMVEQKYGKRRYHKSRNT